MISNLGDSSEPNCGFIVMPNKAMPWNQLVLLYCIIAFVSLGIAMAFFVQGLVLILPFAGIELFCLAVALYISAWRGGEREVIHVDDEAILIERGHNVPEWRCELKRDWAKVELEKPWHNWYPSKLYLRSHGRQVEIGRFLNEEERQGLAVALKKLLNNRFINEK